MAALRVAWGSRSAGTRGCGVRTCRPGPGRPGAGDGGSMEQRERGCGVPRLPGEPGPNRASGHAPSLFPLPHAAGSVSRGGGVVAGQTFSPDWGDG